MPLTELLESVRRAEVRTNRLVNAGRIFNPLEFERIRNQSQIEL